MKNTFGSQQGDAWLRNRCGRITASRIVDVCSYVAKGSKERNDKRIEAGASRANYRLELISERLTGKTKDHYNSLAMQRGSQLEESALLFYEEALRVMVQPVNFVLHPLYDFTGASPDGLCGSEGMVEVKCLLPWNHLEVMESNEIAPERFAQVGWQLTCGGKERRWSDLVHWCPDIQCESLRFKYQRIGRNDLEWDVPEIVEGKLVERKLTGESVIEYFTSEVLKLNAEIEYFLAEHEAKPVAPFPVQLIEEDAATDPTEYDPTKSFSDNCTFLDQYEMTP